MTFSCILITFKIGWVSWEFGIFYEGCSSPDFGNVPLLNTVLLKYDKIRLK